MDSRLETPWNGLVLEIVLCPISENQTKQNSTFMVSPLGHPKSYESPYRLSLKTFGLNLTNKNQTWSLHGLLLFKLDGHLSDMLLSSLWFLCASLYLMDKFLSCSCYDDGKKQLVELLPFEEKKKKESKQKMFWLLFISRICWVLPLLPQQNGYNIP